MATQTEIPDVIREANDALLKAQDQRTNIEVQAKTAMESGNLAEVMKLGGEFQKAEVAIVKAQRQVTVASSELTKAERDTLVENIGKSLTEHRQGIQAAIRAGHISIIATRSGDETGFDDFRLSINLDNGAASTLSDLVHEMLIEVDADNVSSAKRIRILGTEVTVDPVIAVSKGSGGGGGTSGKGYVKDGVSVQLQAAFDQVATAEEKAQLSAMNGDSNKTFSHKKKVVLAAGFSQN